jgi:hypothetical protein
VQKAMGDIGECKINIPETAIKGKKKRRKNEN